MVPSPAAGAPPEGLNDAAFAHLIEACIATTKQGHWYKLVRSTATTQGARSGTASSVGSAQRVLLPQTRSVPLAHVSTRPPQSCTSVAAERVHVAA